MKEIKTKLNRILNEFEAIHLNEMERVSLMKRIDSKFVIPIKQFIEILPLLSNDYYVLEIKNHRFQEYNSLYFDTEANKFYHDHHIGKTRRKKVRYRKYVNSGDCFLEIKSKNSKGVTNKVRMPVDDIKTVLEEKEINFTSNYIPQKLKLQARLRNKFHRISLVSVRNNERLTIDFGLELFYKNSSHKYNNLAIIELKQEKVNRFSKTYSLLRDNNISPFRISKYCIGMAILHEGVKKHNFKHKILKLNSLNKLDSI